MCFFARRPWHADRACSVGAALISLDHGLAGGPLALTRHAVLRTQIMDELAGLYGLAYEVRTADIDEKAIRHDDPHQLVLALGRWGRAGPALPLRMEALRETAHPPGVRGGGLLPPCACIPALCCPRPISLMQQ